MLQISLISAYGIFLCLGIGALWPGRKQLGAFRFAVLCLIAPITEMAVLVLSVPRIYCKQIRGINARLITSDIDQRKDLRKKLGGLRIV